MTNVADLINESIANNTIVTVGYGDYRLLDHHGQGVPDTNQIRNINPVLSPIESSLLDFILAACVQSDFDNAPPETPYAIWLDDDIVGSGYDPQDAICEARDQIIEWTRNEARQADYRLLVGAR